MRTLLLAFMIALLPIRGWLGDAMAVEMVRHSLPASEAVVSAATGIAESHCHEAGMEADTGHDMAAMHDIDSGDSQQPHGTDHADCGTCVACQVCHTVALGGMPLVDTPHAAPQALPAAHAARFASAEPVLGLKPPIS
ncbi:hypothetical protein [Variovorax sp. Root473]|jgi:hypothetical protein|uniref:hypothetical protein n=1 Tax=Variovorax sp. Root473 TaxID=1736541 RepID=UPI0006F55AB2|nr:hypothetical protein [Variovorax sp. Root473]KQX86815.1 hypothetical protein ASD34_10755 [Variovorax sp. Root473]